MQDFIKALEKFKENMDYEIDEKAVDTMTIVEELNPDLTDDSEKFRDNNKVIFKEAISSKNANDLVELVLNTSPYNIGNIRLYKEEILSKCNNIHIQGENPIEMLVYSIKGISNKEIYINAIRDVIKTFYEDNSEPVLVAYKNILNKWTWNDCLELVLKSIIELKIFELANEIYYVFKNNAINRELAAQAIISLEVTELFESMLNFTCTLESGSATEKERINNIIYSMVKHNKKNAIYIYKCYVKLTLDRRITNMLSGALKFAINKEILEDIERKLRNSELQYNTFIKLINLLDKSKSANPNILQILINALRIPHLNEAQKDNIRRAIGDADPEMQLEMIIDRKVNSVARRNAIISMATCNDERYLKAIDKVAKESERFDAVVCSVKVQRGDIEKVINLFKYIVTKDEYDEVSIEATNQIKRLRSLKKDEELKRQLLTVATSLLANDDISNIKKVNIILDIFSSGVPTDEVGELFLNKLKTTKHSTVKSKIINFYKKEFNRLKSDELKRAIKDVIVDCTYESEVSKEAMDCLRAITAYSESTPTLGEIK